MKTENVILTKSYQFSLRIIKLYMHLKQNHKEFELSKQVLRSGTSVGANPEEGVGAQSKKDFIAKFSIAHKEARETHYWLRLLRDSGLIEPKLAESLIEECEELKRITASILKSSKRE